MGGLEVSTLDIKTQLARVTIVLALYGVLADSQCPPPTTDKPGSPFFPSETCFNHAELVSDGSVVVPLSSTHNHKAPLCDTWL